ncbi:hypothetical protein DSC45_18575 [Streptomyces sp. YIM 130001]|uniref:hypothetical protein n=1 Tax=Streptomyces sp. YIM 130001 TaxID=2259644 RepID=UPI000E64723D|nr:hypothetical protein [Streptomyces sp. YIM 130001]RII15311.1 hypothetical protein DSC45_18575 [Streptomyces sp. YIM 130001]
MDADRTTPYEDARPSERAVMWHLYVERHEGLGAQVRNSELLGTIFGARRQALDLLEELARAYVPEHPKKRLRTQFYRTDHGFLMIDHGRDNWRYWQCEFRALELLWDTGDPDRQPRPLPPRPEAPPRPPADQPPGY